MVRIRTEQSFEKYVSEGSQEEMQVLCSWVCLWGVNLESKSRIGKRKQPAPLYPGSILLL